MLHLRRSAHETIVLKIPGFPDVSVVVLGVDANGSVRIGVDADPSILIVRKELLDRSAHQSAQQRLAEYQRAYPSSPSAYEAGDTYPPYPPYAPYPSYLPYPSYPSYPNDNATAGVWNYAQLPDASYPGVRYDDDRDADPHDERDESDEDASA